jgi:hypothetical protein
MVNTYNFWSSAPQIVLGARKYVHVYTDALDVYWSLPLKSNYCENTKYTCFGCFSDILYKITNHFSPSFPSGSLLQNPLSSCNQGMKCPALIIGAYRGRTRVTITYILYYFDAESSPTLAIQVIGNYEI